jgi:NCAIR mutase (PurE)-related protein
MDLPVTTPAEVQLDLERRARIGLDETIFAEGKSAAQLEVIFSIAQERAVALFITRLSQEKLGALAPGWRGLLDYCPVSRTAIFGTAPAATPLGESVAIVSGGTSDVPVAREAERTLAFRGVTAAVYFDVGVAGLWRLTSRLERIGGYPIVIAVAGMDAALPTVLGGLIPGLIIAVPTSVGYGVAAGGRTALHALLASCAPGITVVNIDNGYGAACAALRAMRIAAHPRTRQSSLP